MAEKRSNEDFVSNVVYGKGNMFERWKQFTPWVYDNQNKVIIFGEIYTKLEYSNTASEGAEKFYRTIIKVNSKEKEVNLIPIIVPSSIIDTGLLLPGKWIAAAGKYSSYKEKTENGYTHRILFLSVQEIYVFDTPLEIIAAGHVNLVYFCGIIHTKPEIKVKKSGKNIADFILAVHNNHGKTAYIPCTTSNKIAQIVVNLDVGTEVVIRGRIKSIGYFKDASIGNISSVQTKIVVSSLYLSEEEAKK